MLRSESIWWFLLAVWAGNREPAIGHDGFELRSPVDDRMDAIYDRFVDTGLELCAQFDQTLMFYELTEEMIFTVGYLVEFGIMGEFEDNIEYARYVESLDELLLGLETYDKTRLTSAADNLSSMQDFGHEFKQNLTKINLLIAVLVRDS